MDSTIYNIHHKPSYTTDEGYQTNIRILFQMNEGEDYDESAANMALDYVYLKTKNHPVFQEIYTLASTQMMSEDPEIGLAVVFSYDYLIPFHAILVAHFSGKDTEPLVQTLKDLLSKK